MNIPRMSYPQHRILQATYERCNDCNGNCLLLDDGDVVSVCRVFPIRCCAGGSRWPSCRWTRPCAPRSPKAGTRSNAVPSAGSCVYADSQPGQILPGLCGAGAPEERGRTPTKKIPPVYAFRAVKVHGNQGFFRMVGRQVDKVILFPSKRGSKCGKIRFEIHRSSKGDTMIDAVRDV